MGFEGFLSAFHFDFDIFHLQFFIRVVRRTTELQRGFFFTFSLEGYTREILNNLQKRTGPFTTEVSSHHFLYKIFLDFSFFSSFRTVLFHLELVHALFRLFAMLHSDILGYFICSHEWVIKNMKMKNKFLICSTKGERKRSWETLKLVFECWKIVHEVEISAHKPNTSTHKLLKDTKIQIFTRISPFVVRLLVGVLKIAQILRAIWTCQHFKLCS